MLLLTYISTASRLYCGQEMDRFLDQLPSVCRKSNIPLDITGRLLYRPNGFIQMLEGPEDAFLGVVKKLEWTPMALEPDDCPRGAS